MWMTRDVLTVTSSTTLAEIAGLMMRRKMRRLPVVAASPDGPRVIGIVTRSIVLHAFPADINPFAPNAAESMAAIERGAGRIKVTAADLMTRDPHFTTPEAPIENAARLMFDHKLGGLPVIANNALVGIITESDIFRAMLEVFEAPDRAIRITFSLTPGEDVLPLVAEIAGRNAMRVTSFMSLAQHAPPVCVVQLAGEKVDEALEEIWKSRHRVLNVVHLVPETPEKPTR